MKNTLLVFSLACLCYSCNNAHSSATTNFTNNTSIVNRPPTDSLYNLFSLDDALKILGEPGHLKDSSSTTGAIFTYRSAYVANAEDKTTGKTGIIYFMFEEYANENSAHKSYTSIKNANEHNGIKVVQGVGDEGYFSGAGEKNYRFALIRSGNKMIRLKVNKVTTYTSYEEFIKVVEAIAHRL